LEGQAILRANDRGGYTVPTDRLYPFQWNWDSAFVALGWSEFDETRAWQEILRLFEGQWNDGLIPHIVFHAPSGDYFPGPDVWGTSHLPKTSGISQPPVLATAIRHLYEKARNRSAADDHTCLLYSKLIASHRWWARARDPERTGLVAILHPWESGMDNSPAWDAALARVPLSATTPIRRRDTDHIAATMRPSDEDYHRYIALVDLFRDLRWDAGSLWSSAPFKVLDIGTNAILHRAERDLLSLAERFGTPMEREELTCRLERRLRAIDALWNPASRIFESFDLVTQSRIPVATSAGFLPLFAGLATGTQAEAMIGEIERWATAVRYLLPSVSPFDPSFDPKRYWRGPVWAVVNQMIAAGLVENGAKPLAARIHDHMIAMIDRGGFAEYFDPLTGEGLGGNRFSWTAATALSWSSFVIGKP
jgi:glycogen debranching enzyme